MGYSCWLYLAVVLLHFLLFSNNGTSTFLVTSMSTTQFSSSELTALRDLYESTHGSSWSWNNPLKAWNFSNPYANPCEDGWEGVHCACLYNRTINATNLLYIDQMLPLEGSFLEKGMEEISILRDGLHYQLIVGNASCPLAASSTDLIQNTNTATTNTMYSYNNTITALILPFHLLNGTLPSTLNQLSNLMILDLSENLLHSSIPDSLYVNMTSLQYLHLGANHLSGTLSNNISLWTSITSIILMNNHFHGSIPFGIGNCLHLHRLQLDLNRLTGSLPDALCHLHSLQALTLAGNRYLHGALPDCIYSSLTNIFEFNVRDNHFSGSIASSIGLWNESLCILDISSNNFKESPPKTLQSMNRLFFLIMAFNSFTGQLSDWLPCGSEGLQPASMTFFHIGSNLFSGPNANCAWPYLSHYLTYSNQLTGSFPTQLISHANGLLGLNIASNYLSGSIPTNTLSNTPYFNNFLLFRNQFTGSFFENSVAFTSLPYVFGIVNYFNFFTGSIPNEFTINSPKIVFFVVFNNLFTGSIPSQFSYLTKLAFYGVNNNMLTGPVSNGIEQLSNLVLVNVGGNQFTGTIARHIFYNNRHRLASFAISNNCLHGSIPPEICNATKLSALSMDGMNTATSCRNVIISRRLYNFEAFVPENSMTGTIPSCLFTDLSHIQLITISGNGLTGSLPDASTLLHGSLPSSLISLSLSHNLLQGTIPNAFSTHNNWYSLDLSFNKLTGTLNDWEYSKLSNDASISLNLNRLSGLIPTSLMSLFHVNILRGNAFTCSDIKKDLPSHDPDKEKYHCGSNSANTSFYAYLLLWLLPCVIFFAISFWPTMRYLRSKQSAGEIELIEKALSDAAHLSEGNNMDKEKNVETTSLSPFSSFVSTSWIDSMKATCGKLLNDWYEMRSVSNNIDMLTSGKRLKNMLSTKEPNDVDILKFFDFLKAFRRCIFELIIAIVMILLPLYITLSVYFGTHSYDYAWLFSAVWISGVLPGAILTCCFIGVILFSEQTLRKHIFAFHHSNDTNSTGDGGVLQDAHSKYIVISICGSFMIWLKRWISAACLWSGFYLIDFVLMLVVDASYVYIYLQYSGVVLVIAQIAISAFKMLWNDKLCIQLLLWYKQKLRAWLRYYHDSSNARLIASIQIMGLDLEQSDEDLNEPTFKVLLTNKDLIKLSLLVIKNKIVIPLFVTMIISSSCFYEIFAQTSPVTANAKFCFPIKFLGIPCESLLSSTPDGRYSYTPAFVYSFECSSAFIRYYSPVYVFMFIGNLIVPCFFLMLKKCYDYCVLRALTKKYGNKENAVKFECTPSLLYPVLHCVSLSAFNEQDVRWLAEENIIFRFLRTAVPRSWYAHLPSDFDCLQCSVTSQQVLVLRLMTSLATMLVFGVIFPPLAILAFISIVCSTLLEEVLFKRLLLRAKALNHHSFLQCARWNSRVLVSSFKESIKSTMTIMAFVLSFVILDTIGDEIGGTGARPACVLILVIMMVQNLSQQLKFIVDRLWNWLLYRIKSSRNVQENGENNSNSAVPVLNTLHHNGDD